MDHPAPVPAADDLAAFRSSLRGRLLEPSDDGYDAARVVWNGMIDRRPMLIARCAGVADVIGERRLCAPPCPDAVGPRRRTQCRLLRGL